MKTNSRDSIIGICVENNVVSACAVSNGMLIKYGRLEAEAGQISQAISQLTEGTGIKKCCIIMPSYSVKTILNPVLKSEKITHEKMLFNIPFEFRNYIGTQEAGQYVYDYMAEQTADNNKSLKVIPVAGRKADILSMENHVRNAGLTPVRVVTKEGCYSRILNKAFKEAPGQVACFVDISENILSIRFYEGRLPVSILEEDIMMNTSYNEMAAFIDRAVDQFTEKTGSDSAIDMYITGEYASDQNIRNILSKRIENIRIKKITDLIQNFGSEEEVSTYAALIGACLMNYANGKTPLTHSMNLLFAEEKVSKPKPIKIMVPVIIVLALALFAYVGIYSPLKQKNTKIVELANSQQELIKAEEKAEKYADVRSEYVQYYRDYETADEKGTLDRTSCLNIIKGNVFPYVTVTDVSMKGNEITIRAENASMKTISKLIKRLNKLEYVDYAVPAQASSDDETDVKDDTIAASTEFIIVLDPSEKIIERGIDEPDKETE